MSITKKNFAQLVKDFNFKLLFNEMGWNKDNTYQIITVDDIPFEIKGIAQKSGFHIFTCESGIKIPDKNIRKKIESKLTKLFQEHLIIFIDSEQKEQVWQLAVREAGNPVKISETKYLITQAPELLYQRASGLFFTLDEEENITIVDVTKRVSENFQQNNEKVTKKFYESFKKEHTAFLKFITGIEDKVNLEWYASLMLNRLMFCYFIQKKGFLDNNLNYLHDKLQECRDKKGKDRFYSFYRNFLLVLFHKALGSNQRNYESDIDFGKIPYLNGGLFDEHELEKSYNDIQIEDKAFEKLFTFFDEWNWHLDTRETSSGKDINPDVIGYIFEKYINDRAQMGAYYTKEDITDYISKNCILPWLFDEVERNYSTPFKPDGSLWKMLKESDDEYIYDAVKKGIPEEYIQKSDSVNADEYLFSDLPDEIKKGFNPDLEKQVVDGKSPYLWELRKEWNKPAPDEIALPTEIYREVIERRKRYAEIRRIITSGKITEINDFITYNLKIRQFVQDTLQFFDDAKFIKEFYKALSKITILDPTCGSGAFIFAAMNILEPLYETCIKQMQEFVNNDGKNKHKYFEEILQQVNSPEHPNLKYFIFKSIILNNLYGVDLMNEAVEIAKLRLFLKLVAEVNVDYKKENYGLEPLPDIDFNIRTGNTLIGYATEKNLDDAFKLQLSFSDDEEKIKNKCNVVANAFKKYKEIQLKGNIDHNEFKEVKEDLISKLNMLRNELNLLLHKQYYTSENYDKWLKSYQPFHWFAEFYEIINGNGGFDVIIGNPPYVRISKIKYALNKNKYISLNGKNIYGPILEKAYLIGNLKFYIGMITPVSICSGSGFSQLMEFIFSKQSWISTFSNRPGKLFDGVEQRLCVFIATKNNNICLTSPYQHWYSQEREFLFDKLFFYNSIKLKHIPLKTGFCIVNQILSKIINASQSFQILIGSTGESWYHDGPTYWIRSLPFFPSGNKSDKSSHYHNLKGIDEKSSKFITALLASTTYYLFYKSSSNCRDFGIENILNFRINKKIPDFTLLIDKYKNKLIKTSKKCSRIYPSGVIEYDEYYPVKAKEIIDQIDSVLAEHYGFTQDELDFIINYDIKYRMGKEL